MAQTASTMLALGTTGPRLRTHRCGQRQDSAPRRFPRQKGAAGHVHLRALPVREAHREGTGEAWQGLCRAAARHRRHQLNDVTTHPADSPAGLKQQAETFGFVFPYLYDETQSAAHAYDAACTPDFLSLRCGFQARVSRPVRCKPPRQRCSRHREGPARGDRRGAGGQAGSRGSEPVHRLQHQVEGMSSELVEWTSSPANSPCCKLASVQICAILERRRIISQHRFAHDLHRRKSLLQKIVVELLQ